MTVTAELHTRRRRPAAIRHREVRRGVEAGRTGPHRPRRHGPPAADRRPHPRRRAVLRVRAEDRRRPTGIATLWVELLTSLSGTIREQTEKVPPGRRAGRQDRRPGRRAGREGRASRLRVGRLAEDEQDSGHHGSERPSNPPEADQRRAGRPAGRPGSRPKMPGRSTKLGAVATGQSSWRASVVFDHHWAVPVREHQLGGHSACAGLGRPARSSPPSRPTSCAAPGGPPRTVGVGGVRPESSWSGWIATNFFLVNISARSAMVTHLSAWVVLTGPREGSHHRWPVSGPCGGDACTWM